MRRTLDALSHDVPHGTVEGYRQGCRTSHCPAGQEHGLSCVLANTYAAGNWQCMKVIQRGLTPAETAKLLGLRPAREKAATKKQKKVQHTEVPAPIVPTREKTMTEEPKTIWAEIRAWARETGIDLPARGALPRAFVDAFNERGKGIQASEVQPESAPAVVAEPETVAEPAPLAPVAQVDTVDTKKDWSLPLAADDRRSIADAIDALEKVPRSVVEIDSIPVLRPGGEEIIGDIVAAAGFGDDPWLGFTPRVAA